MHTCAQGGAVFLGLVFPFCPGRALWGACMSAAVCLYATNFLRMARRSRKVPTSLGCGATTEERERFNATRIVLQPRYLTTAMWTVIVSLFFAYYVYGPWYAPEGLFLRHPAADAMCECFFDVLLKVIALAGLADGDRTGFLSIPIRPFQGSLL